MKNSSLKIKAIRALFYSLFIFFLASESVFGKEIYWDKYHIELSGFSENQLLILESTLGDLKSLQPDELLIKKRIYKRLSRFGELFGFKFRGEELFHWLMSRIHNISYQNNPKAAINQNNGDFFLGDVFFKNLNEVERLYLLIHEARHSDGNGYVHTKCPKGFKFITATQPHMDLEKELACDTTDDGAYAFQAAFLFELFAYGIFESKEVGLLYNSSISRISP